MLCVSQFRLWLTFLAANANLVEMKLAMKKKKFSHPCVHEGSRCLGCKFPLEADD